MCPYALRRPAGSLDENDLPGLDLGSLGSLGSLVGQPPGMGPRDVLLDTRGPAATAAAANAGAVQQPEQPQPQPLVAGSQAVGAGQEAAGAGRVVVADATVGGASSSLGAAAAAAGAAALGLGPPASVLAQGPPPVLSVAHRDVFHVSRGTQRSIGSMMVVTPMGKQSRKGGMHFWAGAATGTSRGREHAAVADVTEWRAVLLMAGGIP